jgi:hypothetical protein
MANGLCRGEAFANQKQRPGLMASECLARLAATTDNNELGKERIREEFV